MELETLSRFLSDFQLDCVFDVGANTGLYGARPRQTGYRGRIVDLNEIDCVMYNAYF